MEKNEFLRYNEFLYRLYRCETMEDLADSFLPQLRLLIPHTHASYIAIERQGDAQELTHTLRFWYPADFNLVEEIWIREYDHANTAWLSHSAESVIVRDSELLEGDKRFSSHFYDGLFKQLQTRDTMQMNVVFGGRILGRLALFRTREYGDFTDQDTFLLRSLANHINLVFFRCTHGRDVIDWASAGRVAKEFGLTRREEEVLAYILSGASSEEISAKLCIAKNTLFKHSQNLYRKCGVKSRWDLLRLLRREQG